MALLFLVLLHNIAYRRTTCAEHHLILQAICDRNPEAAVNCMSAHVTLRQEQLVEVIKEGVAWLYMT